MNTNSAKRFFARINGGLHEQALWLYMLIVFGHWLEHIAQVYQVYILGWVPAKAGGALGLVAPGLAMAEVLHFGYNLFLIGGIVLLRPGFAGRSRFWWNLALLAQGWHFFEHILLQAQYLTGHYLFGASMQISILQQWFPRVELHFMYNLIVFLPLLIGVLYHFYPPPNEPVNERCTCNQLRSHRQTVGS